jgi:hypothetical protein
LYSVEKPKMTRIRPAVWICSGYWLELAMMGRRTTRRKYFVSVSLDEYVPENHLLRAADHFKELKGSASEVSPQIGSMEQPSRRRQSAACRSDEPKLARPLRTSCLARLMTDSTARAQRVLL